MLELDECKAGVEVIQVVRYQAKESWPSRIIKSRPYRVGDGPWVCILDNDEIVEINKLIKI